MLWFLDTSLAITCLNHHFLTAVFVSEYVLITYYNEPQNPTSEITRHLLGFGVHCIFEFLMRRHFLQNTLDKIGSRT